MLAGEWLCTAFPQGALSAVQRDRVLAERRRQKIEVDWLRRKAARRARYRLPAATATADAEAATVLHDNDASDPSADGVRSVSTLGLATN